MRRKHQAVPLNLGTLCSQGYLSGCLRGQEAIRWTIILQCRIYSMVSKLNILFLLNREKEGSCKFALILIIKMKFQNNCVRWAISFYMPKFLELCVFPLMLGILQYKFLRSIGRVRRWAKPNFKKNNWKQFERDLGQLTRTILSYP